ncbi:MAG: 3-oxo-5-alpha-steroid 4-dehydrogenase [Candidatus Aminicenantes bacterium]|nr:MAG: 3-oxo-5-alpha-steroid 4-dehydrogenase [Candidatus Aminicenantes bacterium]
MDEWIIYKSLLYAFLILAGLACLAIFHITVPYGRHTRQGWGPRVSNRLGWFLIEFPALLSFVVIFWLSPYRSGLPAFLFFILWVGHYVQRSLIYPLLIRTKARKVPLSIIILSVIFGNWNGYLNSRWLFAFSGGYPRSWVTDLRFILGCGLFIGGFILNVYSDHLLRRLRKPGENGYKIPRGGLFEYVSCANYFGEIIEWFGWALATWSLPGLAFAIWTVANLAPRARSHHRWYREHFPDYPPHRKALIPFIW